MFFLQECLEVVAPVLQHAVDLVNDYKQEIASTHRELQTAKTSDLTSDHSGPYVHHHSTYDHHHGHSHHHHHHRHHHSESDEHKHHHSQ
jgi:hypothetical protein